MRLGALIALVSTTLPSAVNQLAHLTLFGVGSTVGMAALSGLFGWSIAKWGVHRAFTRGVSLVCWRRVDRPRNVPGLPFAAALFQ